jgi:hypothetical protein
MTSFKDFIESEKSQLDALIKKYEEKIETLTKSKSDLDDQVDEATQTSPGVVAADEDASQEERTAAAGQAISQDPQRVNAEQSYPTPSTHSEQFEKTDEEVQAEAQAKADEAAKPKRVVGETQAAHDIGHADPEAASAEEAERAAETKKEPEDADKVSEPASESQGVTLPDGRGDPNKLGDTGPGPDALPADDESGIRDAKGSDADKKKQTETNKNKTDVATKGKTDDK